MWAKRCSGMSVTTGELTEIELRSSIVGPPASSKAVTHVDERRRWLRAGAKTGAVRTAEPCDLYVCGLSTATGPTGNDNPWALYCISSHHRHILAQRYRTFITASCATHLPFAFNLPSLSLSRPHPPHHDPDSPRRRSWARSCCKRCHHLHIPTW